MVAGNQKQKWAGDLPLFLAIALVSLLGAALVLYDTRGGPRMSGDSVEYLWGAKSLLAGNGYSYTSGGGEHSPIVGFPPMTAISLALAGITGADMISAGRWLNAFFFAASIFLSGYLTLRYTRSILAALVVSGLLAWQPAMIQAHAQIMSEGLFIWLVLLCFWGLLHALEGGSRWSMGIGGLLAGLAVLTRYVGLVIFPAAVLTIAISPLFLHRAVSWKRRFTDMVFFSAAGLLPVALWFGRNTLLSGSAANRQTSLELLLTRELFVTFVDTMLSWTGLSETSLKWRVQVALFGILMVAVLGAFVFRELRKRPQAGDEPQGFKGLPWLLIFYIPAYLGLILVNSAFFDNSTSDAGMRRYLTPVFVVWVILMACALHRLASGRYQRLLRAGLGIVGALLLLGYARPSVERLNTRGGDYGYTDFIQIWKSEADALHSLDARQVLITNEQHLLYLLCERHSYALPAEEAQASANGWEATLRQKLQSGAALVIFLNRGGSAQNKAAGRLIDELHLEVIADAPHMRIYGVGP